MQHWHSVQHIVFCPAPKITRDINNDITKKVMITYIRGNYLDALSVQFPSVYGLQCWVKDTKLTSTSFTLLVNRSTSHRLGFLSTITLVFRSVGQICFQLMQPIYLIPEQQKDLK
jgi:hypothetical protein